jgi:hypothetical protein
VGPVSPSPRCAGRVSEVDHDATHSLGPAQIQLVYVCGGIVGAGIQNKDSSNIALGYFTLVRPRQRRVGDRGRGMGGGSCRREVFIVSIFS